LDIRSDDIPNFGFDDGSLTLIDQVDFGFNWVNADHEMPFIGETTGRYRAHISQTEDADSQKKSSYLRLSSRILGKLTQLQSRGPRPKHYVILKQ
jgi:hypothetical protein